MLVEVVGCTGSGKTTLSGNMTAALRNAGVAARVVPLEKPGLLIQSARNISEDIIAMTMMPRLLKRHGAYFHFAWKTIAQYGDTFSTNVNLYRSVVRKIARHERYIRSRSPADVTVLDEGAVHTSHQVLIHRARVVPDHEILNFWKMVPKPDLIIFVRASRQTVFDRTMKRPDPPRRFGLRDNWARFIDNAVATYERLFSMPDVTGRVISVDSSGVTGAATDKLTQIISDMRRVIPLNA